MQAASSAQLPPAGNVPSSQEKRGGGRDVETQAFTESLMDRIIAMRKQESVHYNFHSYFRCQTDECDADIRENNWREKIVHWTYSVVDHFDLSREVVAVSLSLFDRFLATRGNRCNGNSALLISLTTLHIAIKLNEAKRLKLSTLANLSRGQFGPTHIEEMEWRILVALSWRVHPPTGVAFLSHLLQFVPHQVHPSVRKDLFELSRYLAELVVCDSYFVEFPSSTVAYASILNVMEEVDRTYLPIWAREKFTRDLSERVHMHHESADVMAARERLRTMFAASLHSYAQEECAIFGDQPLSQPAQQVPQSVQPNETTTTTTTALAMTTAVASVDDGTSRASSKASSSIRGAAAGPASLAGRNRSRSGSYDSAGSWSRYSVSPQVGGGRRSRHRARSPSCASAFRNRASNSPSVTTVQ